MEPYDVDTNPVSWREAGEGSLILFLHGLGGTRIAWEPQLHNLSDQWRCVAWDMPGYGSSPTPTEPLTFASLADAVIQLLDVLEVDHSVIVGLSMGGMIGLHTALNHPDRVSSLILVDSSPSFGFDGTTDANSWINERISPLQEGRTLGEIAPDVLRSITAPQTDNSVIDEAVQAMARISTSGFTAAVHCLTTHNVTNSLNRIDTPTMVIVGDQDKETPPSYSRYLADHIPNARYAEIAGAGHLSNLEAPEIFNRLMREFLTMTTV